MPQCVIAFVRANIGPEFPDPTATNMWMEFFLQRHISLKLDFEKTYDHVNFLRRSFDEKYWMRDKSTAIRTSSRVAILLFLLVGR